MTSFSENTIHQNEWNERTDSGYPCLSLSSVEGDCGVGTNCRVPIVFCEGFIV